MIATEGALQAGWGIGLCLLTLHLQTHHDIHVCLVTYTYEEYYECSYAVVDSAGALVDSAGALVDAWSASNQRNQGTDASVSGWAHAWSAPQCAACPGH